MSRHTLKLFALAIPCIMLWGCAAMVTAIVTVNWWGPKLGAFLTIDNSATPIISQDAIVVLGGSTVERMNTAITIYPQGQTPHVAITGYNPDDRYAENQTTLAFKSALAYGIPEQTITLLQTDSTAEDAEQIARFARESNVRRLLLVSDWYHARRAVCMVKQRLGAHPVEVNFKSSEAKSAANNWWQSEDGITATTDEILKLGYYAFQYRLPFWNCLSGDLNLPVILGFCVIACIMSFIIADTIRRLALRLRIMDVPNARSAHTQPIPRGGGLGIVIATLAIFLTSFLVESRPHAPIYSVLVLCTAIIAAVGWLDDRFSVPIKIRLVLQIVITTIFMIFAGAISSVFIPILGIVTLIPAVSLAITGVWIVAFINQFNFMDGIDGIAGLQAFIAASGWFVLLSIEGQKDLALLSGLLAAGSVGFLFLNASPARIFMGDVGSTFLGAMLAILPVIAYTILHNPRLFVTGVIFVAPFVFDSTLTIVRRRLKGENIFSAHRTHLYQRLVQCGYSHAQVTGLYGALAVVSVLAGIIYYGGGINITFIALLLIMALLTAHAIFVQLHLRKPSVTIIS